MLPTKLVTKMNDQTPINIHENMAQSVHPCPNIIKTCNLLVDQPKGKQSTTDKNFNEKLELANEIWGFSKEQDCCSSVLGVSPLLVVF